MPNNHNVLYSSDSNWKFTYRILVGKCSALSLLFSCAPLERANPSSDDLRRPRGLSYMSGGVRDPASWIAGATESELERLLVFVGNHANAYVR